MRTYVAAIVAVVCLAAPSIASAAPPLPNSIAGIGDSITRAADVCCWYGDHPAQSWSTGGGAFDGISSHYERIRALKPSIYGHNYNDAKSGAKMRDAIGQAQAAVSQGAMYVTILMGANDVCTGSAATMTSVGDFTAQLVWAGAGICQSMLSLTNSEADRQAVVAREAAFNQVLAQVCGQYAFCRYDDGATFNFSFSRSDVSKLDYFHPSLGGQAKLASLTWARSWWAAS